MPKVLGLVSFRIFPTHMGGQKGVAHFYRHLQKFLPLILATSIDNQKSDGVPTRNLLFPNRKIYRNFFRTKQLARLVKEEQVDIILAEHSYSGWMAWNVQRSTGKPFVIHSHNIESRRFHQMHHWWWKIYERYEAWIHRQAQHSFFISQEDMEYAIARFHVPPAHCSVVTYGIENKKISGDKSTIRKELGIDPHKKILLFNGTLDYTPNYDAVVTLVDSIEPALRQKMTGYHIIITGNRAPDQLARKMLSNENITYTGYVPDVDLYYQAADLFLNPISNDSGVKTKVIEAIANNCTTISTESGVSGIARSTCRNKIITVADGAWNDFADAIIAQLNITQSETPQAFYDYYSWDAIASAAADTLKALVK